MISISPWIAFTVMAALMQAVRTAGQKQLSSSVSPMSSTLIRYVFGLPFAIIYLIYITGSELGDILVHAVGNQRFVLFALAASLAQIIATFLLVKVFTFRNFTVGTSLAKTEAVQAAVFGTVMFGMPLTLLGWLAVALGFLGIFIVSMPAAEQRWEPRTVILGTLSGTAFALTSLWLREASLSLNLRVLPSAAMTWQNPALVKSLGQVEFIFTLLLTTLFFKERVTARELSGVAAIIGSVILILQIR